MLALRSAILGAVRGFFSRRGFVEVETPALVTTPAQEAYLEPLSLSGGGGWLITSPEHHMKRLLARGGLTKIYQICRCFRGGEWSDTHRPEFTMVEWYRAHAGYDRIMTDVEALVADAAQAIGRGAGRTAKVPSVDLSPPWPRLTVARAFERYGGVPRRCLSDTDASIFRDAARAAGCVSIDDDDDWETIFHKLLVERIEPALAALKRGVHLKEYPAPLAALARLKDGDSAVAERFESYAGGLELANGFGELTDARQQRSRFLTERIRRRQQGRDPLPVDEEFLRDLASMPPASGVALGIDRLIMLVSGARRIDEVVGF